MVDKATERERCRLLSVSEDAYSRGEAVGGADDHQHVPGGEYEVGAGRRNRLPSSDHRDDRCLRPGTHPGPAESLSVIRRSAVNRHVRHCVDAVTIVLGPGHQLRCAEQCGQQCRFRGRQRDPIGDLGIGWLADDQLDGAVPAIDNPDPPGAGK